MTAAADKTRRVYYSTVRGLPMENSDPLGIAERVTLVGEPYGCAIAHIETGRLLLAPDDEQPGAKKTATKTIDQGA